MLASSDEVYFEISNKLIGRIISALKSLLLGTLLTSSDVSQSAMN